MPKISVIMPAYNAEDYIAEAIDSILSQSFRDFEFLILNDCSKDGTENIIASYNDERIVYVKNEENMGVARTLNKGLALAKGEYIARMDADDISLPERFRLQAAFLDENPAVAVVAGSVACFGAREQVIRFSDTPQKLRVDLLFGNCFAHPSVMMRRCAVTELGGYDPDYEGLEDYELWSRISEKWELAALQQQVLRYRIHPGQVTQKALSEEKQQRYRAVQRRLFRQAGADVDSDGFEAVCRMDCGDEETLKACAGFLRSVAKNEANRKKYDLPYLAASARGAVLRYVDRLPAGQAFWMAAKCGVGPVRYGLRRLRQGLRK